MPNYVKSTLAAEMAALQKLHEVRVQLDQALADKKMSEDLAGRLRGERGTLVQKMTAQLDRVFTAIDAAEANNQKMCDYIEKLAGESKLIYDKVEQVVALLEKQYDDKLALGVVQAVAALEKNVRLWGEDIQAMTSATMTAYREDWQESLRDWMPDRANEVANKHRVRKAGIERSTRLGPKADRLAEYVSRGQAKLKTVERLRAADDKDEKELAKLREGIIALEKSIAERCKEVTESITGMVNSLGTQIKRFVGAKALTKENALGVVALEGKVARFASETKAKVKTMRVQLDEQKKAVVSQGKGDVFYNQYFKPANEKAEKTLLTVEDRLKKFNDVDVKEYNAVLLKAKAVK